MTIEIDGLKININASYGMKVGLPDYSSKDAHVSYSIVGEAVPDGATHDQIVKTLGDIHDKLMDGAKLAVFADLDVAYDPATMQPVATVSSPPVSAAPYPQGQAAPAPAAPAPQGQGQGGGAGQYGPPKVDLAAEAQQVIFTIDGQSVAFYDQRPFKADGRYKPGAADFRSVAKGPDGKFKPIWINDKNGTPVAATAELMESMQVLASSAPY